MTGQTQIGRRRRVRTGVAMAAVLTAGGLITTACSANTPSTAPSATPAPPAGAAPHPLRGTISSENTNSWTVTTAKGVSYTVTITPATTFGTKQAPTTRQSFPVGDHIVVTGTRTGTGTGTTIDRIAPARADIPATPAPVNPSTPPAAGG
jgi:hypothetical protein